MLMQADPNEFELEGLADETLANYLAINQETYTLSVLTDMDRELIFISQGDLSERYPYDDPHLFGLDWWTMSEDYPDLAALLQFSKPGFDNNLEQALVEISYYDLKNIGCREGRSYSFLKSEVGWEIIDNYYTYEC